jgi:hypothetical protein
VVEFNAHRGYPCREQWVGRVVTPKARVEGAPRSKATSNRLGCQAA